MALFFSVFVVVVAAVGAAVVAGIYASLSIVVVPALRRLKPGNGAVTMRAMKRSSLRWPMAVILGGTALVATIAPVLNFVVDAGGPNRWWVVAGAVLTWGAFVVSLIGTGPLDGRLGSLESAEAAEFWPHYSERWTAWNDLRAALAGAGAILMVVSLVA